MLRKRSLFLFSFRKYTNALVFFACQQAFAYTAPYNSGTGDRGIAAVSLRVPR